jgi:hypothetical protein
MVMTNAYLDIVHHDDNNEDSDVIGTTTYTYDTDVSNNAIRLESGTGDSIQVQAVDDNAIRVDWNDINAGYYYYLKTDPWTERVKRMKEEYPLAKDTRLRRLLRPCRMIFYKIHDFFNVPSVYFNLDLVKN